MPVCSGHNDCTKDIMFAVPCNHSLDNMTHSCPSQTYHTIDAMFHQGAAVKLVYT